MRKLLLTLLTTITSMSAIFYGGNILAIENPTTSEEDFLNSKENGDSSMSYAKEIQAKKLVIGIPIKTSNENGRFQKEVPPLWGRFYSENLAEKIPHRLNKNLLAVYTQYEGDYTKPFTYLIGCEVSSLDIIPEGMIGIEIPASPYTVFTAKGPFPQSMMYTWQSIWNSGVKRSYTTDFEVYTPDFNPQNNPEIKIYIGTK